MNKVKDYKDAQAHYAKDDRGESKGAFLAFIREPSSMDQEPRNMVDGGRTGFFKAGIVKQGPNTGKWSVPDFDPGSRNTVFFESEETANKAIADRKIKTSRYEKSRNILNDPKLKKEFLKYAMGKDVTGKMIRKKYGLGNEEFFEGGLRDIIDKDFKKFSQGGIKQKTIKNMVLLHNNKLSKDYITKGLIVPNKIIEKLGLNSSEAATATTRLSQHYGGFDFGFDELKNIRRNANSSNKLFEAMNKFAFGNPYRSSLYRTSLELIDEQLGNERGTFSSLKNKARKVLKTNGIKGFDINEIAGVTGTARTGVGEFSQFMDVMDSNLNQKEMASFQSAFSRARQDIKNNPKNFATQSKQINRLAADFERRYNVKLPRIRNSADVEKYYSPKRLQELKDQGLDIKKASKKLKYTIQMPKGASTINEFVNDPKKQKDILKKASKFELTKLALIGCPGKGKADGGRIGFNDGQNLIKCATKAIPKLQGDPGKLSPGDQANLRALAKSGKAVKFLKGILGPGAIITEVLYEGGAAANKFFEGMPLKQALGESYINKYLLGPKTQIDLEAERAKEMAKGEEYAMAERGRRKAPFMAQSKAADEIRLKKREQQMEEKFPTYTNKDIDAILKQQNLDTPDQANKELGYDFGMQQKQPGIGDMEYNEEVAYNDINNMIRLDDRNRYFADNFRQEKAGGGIAGLSGGDKSGAAPTRGPNSQGLFSLRNNVKKR